MVENAVNQQENKRKAGTVHFAAKMPSKNDDDGSYDDNELNHFEKSQHQWSRQQQIVE